MRWSERQQALLAEMGVRLWAPVGAASVGTAPFGAAPVGAAPAADAAALDAAAPPGAPALPQLSAAGAPPGHAEPAVSHSRAIGPPATSTGVAAMGWPEMRDAVAGCTACRLCESRRRPVFGGGAERADWMLVGELPGEDDDLQGEPFAGKPGELLDNMLRSVGLTRGEASGSAAVPVFVTHAVKCRPLNGRLPRVDELAQCEPYLERQIELVQPKVIVAMGAVAVQSLLRSDEPIGRLRGRVHHAHGVPLVVTYPPNYLLRHPQDKARTWDDLCLAAETVAMAGRPT